MEPRFDTRCPGCFAETGQANPCPHCGHDERAERNPLLLPQRTRLHEQFLIGRVLGEPGGYGITYLAWDLGLQTRVAIKEFLPRDWVWRASDGATVTAQSPRHAEQFRFGLEQFLREARTLAQLDHPNIVRVRQFFEANGTAYLVMDYYAGLSLAEHLESQGGRLPEAQAKDLLLPILDGLRAVHARDVLHRDIKPQNIYLARLPSGGVRPILLDFGAARQAIGEHSRSLSVILTPGYAPFEQYHRKGQQGPWTDVYAAAATLYRMVTGEPPPEANERMAGDDLRPATDFGVTRPLSDALGQGLAMDPAARPQTVQTFQALLSPLDPDPDPKPKLKPVGWISAAHPPSSSASPQPSIMHRWWPLALVLGLPALALAGWYLAREAPHADPPRPDVAALHRAADDRAYGIALDADTPAAYRSYLNTCAADGCGHQAEAERRRDQAAQAARAAEQARAAEVARQADLADYAAAERTGTADAYRTYLANCAPQGCAKRAEAQANRDRLARRDLQLPELVRLAAGSFSMGCQPGEKDCSSDETDDQKRPHRVQVPAFELGATEVTRAQFGAFVKARNYRTEAEEGDGCYGLKDGSWTQDKSFNWRNVGFAQGDDSPVVCVTWNDAQRYVGWLSQETGQTWRLPTEAEWEYAARAGTTTPFSTGNCIRTDQANYDGNYDYNDCGAKTGVFLKRTQPVRSYPANRWGLYEMHGNVWEWVEDCYHDNYTGAPKDGSEWLVSCSESGRRVLRGGSWNDDPRLLRSAYRDGLGTGRRLYCVGFRVARTLTP
jgi:formylglycine-generating enzyme required for sulfatase activity/serine/threonine protein kinase